jgi:rhodanese-related sulfurtransferase
VGKVGLTEREARKEGFDVETALVPAPDKAHFYPGAKQIIIKLVVERRTGRLLGAQIVGHGEVVKRIDVATALITCGATVDVLAKLDLGYAPPFSSAMDPLITAANVVKNKLEGRMRGVSPEEVKHRLDARLPLFLLDVRNDDEYVKGHIPRSVLVPLPQLASRLNEIPRDGRIVVVCGVGLRAYNGSLKLRAAGYQDVCILDGGMAAWPYSTE